MAFKDTKADASAKTIIPINGYNTSNNNTEEILSDNRLKIQKAIEPTIWLQRCQINVKDIQKAINFILLKVNNLRGEGYRGVFTTINRHAKPGENKYEINLIFDVNACSLINKGALQGNILRGIAQKMGRPELDMGPLFEKLNGVMFFYTDISKMKTSIETDDNGNQSVLVKCELDDILYTIHGIEMGSKKEIRDIIMRPSSSSNKIDDVIVNYDILLVDEIEELVNKYDSKQKVKFRGRITGNMDTL